MLDAMTIPNCAKGTAIVASNVKLNVRADPHQQAKALGQLVPSEVVTVWAVEGDWAIVQNTAGLTGWAAVQYLDLGELVA